MVGIASAGECVGRVCRAITGSRAQCEGKTVTDEFAFSLLGENFHYGTPLNPAAPDRVPGGSSSGSASAVACGLVDFALGTDTGGSVRVPASNCGLWGWRPSHGLISVAGVIPFAPTLDTVGVFTRSAELLRRVAAVLLAAETDGGTAPEPGGIHLVKEAFEIADPTVRDALRGPIEQLQKTYRARVRETSLGQLCGDQRAADLGSWLTIYRVLQGTEFASCVGSWIADARPKLGPAMLAGLEFVGKIDRTRVGEAIGLREYFARQIDAALRQGDLLCLPTAPSIAPLKGSKAYDRNSDYYRQTLSINAVAGVGRLPQVSMPLGAVEGSPIGLSLVGRRGADMELIDLATRLGSGSVLA